MSIPWPEALRQARRARGLSQAELAARAGVSRMTVQKLESGNIDARLSTLEVLVRALGLELVLVPASLRPAVDAFLQSGGRLVAQPAGVGAPRSIVDLVVNDDAIPRRKDRP